MAPRQGRLEALAGGVSRAAALGAVLASPWLFGGVQTGVQVGLLRTIAVALGCGALAWSLGTARRESAPRGFAPLMLVLLLGIALGAIQLLPLEQAVVQSLSPGSARWRAPIEREGPDGASAAGAIAAAERAPISLSPASTRQDVFRLVAVAGTFLTGAMVFATCRARLWLCGLLGLNGAAFALFGLAQRLSWNGKLYWTVPLPEGGGPFAAFVNRNHAGSYLTLCLAGALGFSVWALGRGAALEEDGSEWSPTPWFRWRQTFARLDATSLLGLIVAALIGGAVFCTLSRGAVLAMLGGFLMIGLVALRSRKAILPLAPMAVVLALAVVLVGWVGLDEALRARLLALRDTNVLAQARFPHWRDGMRAGFEFFPLGSGLGSYRHAYRPYQGRLDEQWYFHAENQYVEAFVEGGLPGCLLLAAALFFGLRVCLRLLHTARDRGTAAFGMAALFALMSQAIHACFDFALYLPANWLLLALITGAAAGTRFQTEPPQSGASRGALRLLVPVLAVLLVCGTVLGSRELSRLSRAESLMRTPVGASNQSPQELQRRIAELEEALHGSGDHAEGRLQLARLWIELYRVHAAELLRVGGFAGTDAEIRQRTDPLVLHGRVHELLRDGEASFVNEIRNEPAVAECLSRAVLHLHQARRACPLLPDVFLKLAELAWVAADSEAETSAGYVARAVQLAPSDPDLQFRCGILLSQTGRMEDAFACWRRSLSLTPRYLDHVLQLVEREPAGVVARAVFPEDPLLLIEAASRSTAQGDLDLRQALTARAVTAIDHAPLPEGDRAYWRGKAFLLEGRTVEALEELTRAVRLRMDQTRWRYELSRLLLETGRVEEAHEHARIAARNEPGNAEYRRLLEQTSAVRVRQGDTHPRGE